MLAEEQLVQFGIELEDEYPHAFSEDHQDWNESYFFDWYDEQGTNAGHCRIGWHPVQKRVLFWLYLFNGSEWLVIEEFRLPFSDLQLLKDNKAFAYQGWGLEFSYDPALPLMMGMLRVKGFARVQSGKRQGMILPVQLSLNVTAQGPAHSRGGGTVENHSAEGFSTNRYEQPIRGVGQMCIDNCLTELEVRGERDHSWGPRPWDMQWQFFVVNNAQFSLQATQVNIPEWPLIKIGYFQALGESMEHLTEADFDLNYNADDPANAVSGSFTLSCDSGRVIKGRIETISGTEIDITHVYANPKRTEYRRSLIRCFFDDQNPSIGWLECNRQID
ncbi:MAG: hypothetical protein HRU20_22550 [Pseudomonadales bacterium]|nr:hypothetical protein [Pseudomonadales bacterium]